MENKLFQSKKWVISCQFPLEVDASEMIPLHDLELVVTSDGFGRIEIYHAKDVYKTEEEARAANVDWCVGLRRIRYLIIQWFYANTNYKKIGLHCDTCKHKKGKDFCVLHNHTENHMGLCGYWHLGILKAIKRFF